MAVARQDQDIVLRKLKVGRGNGGECRIALNGQQGCSHLCSQIELAERLFDRPCSHFQPVRLDIENARRTKLDNIVLFCSRLADTL